MKMRIEFHDSKTQCQKKTYKNLNVIGVQNLQGFACFHIQNVLAINECEIVWVTRTNTLYLRLVSKKYENI